ncbi:FHIP family protein CG3558 isoform X2 [Venturia canescens]|uniref:FHIP family protein CG3558 isoform X2 n=1 Tax=Venturia canescens TaxID=32260 RepID=UPI001C9C730E|nr:FHIP family protein CG3558 isoform X2 [Venturia canescens]
MSWLRSSPLRASFSKQHARDSPPKDADPTACYDSFCKHWQQTHEIIRKTRPPRSGPTHDEILGVVNHVDQMVTLLLLELRNTASAQQRKNPTPTHSPCLEYLLSENLLDALFELSTNAGRYTTVLRLKQLKLHELLISYSSTLLAHEPVARPILRFLEACANDILEYEVEKRLISLLNQLCVAIMQNIALLDLFFQPNGTGNNKFIIFTLLIPHIHREGPLGQQARDAMLLCMSLSKKNDDLGVYIADSSNVCPVLATGLSGLYSVLPRKLAIETDDWHRLTPDDVNEIPELTQLMDSLEFCNAVAQVAHPLIQQQLLEFLYQGFLVPVMGPALLQDSLGLTLDQLDAPDNRLLSLTTTVEELVSATAYFDLFLRSVTDPGLLRSLVRFLLEDNYDLCRILDSLIQRISSRSRLCIVTLALFETLVELNCEDVMLELCLGALAPCSHVMLSQRRRLRDVDPFGRGAEKFLSLTPACCLSFHAGSSQTNVSRSLPHVPSENGGRRRSSVSCSSNTVGNAENAGFASLPAPINYGSKHTESLYGNYHAYLYDARQKIVACQTACSMWSSRYDGEPNENNKNSSGATLVQENSTLADQVNLWRIENDESKLNRDTRIEKQESIEWSRDSSRPVSDPATNRKKDTTSCPPDLSPSERENVSSGFTSQENILDNIKSLLEADEVLEEILAEEKARDTSSEDKNDPGEVVRTLSAEEQGKLEADIAELLGEDLHTITNVSGESRSTSPGEIETTDSHVESRGFDKRTTLFETENDDSNTAMNSLLSLGESSGYESFAFKGSSESTPENEHSEDRSSEHDLSNGDITRLAVIGEATISNDSAKTPTDSHNDNGELEESSDSTIDPKNQIAQRQDLFNGKPNVGIFLDVILRKLECMTSNNVYVNLHLTGLISRLAIYPQPLLQSFLLNHSLVFQPSIRSLLQVLASLKHKIDQYLSKIEDIDQLVEQARTFLIGREDRLVNARKNALEAAAQSPQMKRTVSASEPFTRGEPKRRSLLGQVFDWSAGNSGANSLRSSLAQKFGMKEELLEITDNGSGYRYYPKTTWESPKDVSPAQNVVLCAVVMDEWLKELAAIAQEHAILSLDSSSEFRA